MDPPSRATLMVHGPRGVYDHRVPSGSGHRNDKTSIKDRQLIDNGD